MRYARISPAADDWGASTEGLEAEAELEEEEEDVEEGEAIVKPKKAAVRERLQKKAHMNIIFIGHVG